LEIVALDKKARQRISGRKWYKSAKGRAHTAKAGVLGMKQARIMKWVKAFDGCAQCGYNKNPAALHFDHIDKSTKLFQVGVCHTRSWKAIFKEMEKCTLLCANCHSERHWLWQTSTAAQP